MKKHPAVEKNDLVLLHKISNVSGLSEFWLGGSATYHTAAKRSGILFVLSDYDLAILGGPKEFHIIQWMLRERRFSILKARPYNLKFHRAFQIVAERGKMTLDIAIVKDLSHLGHFNWESIFWHFPSGKLHDPYDGINAIRKRKLAPTISPKEENPYILASRLINLCARFNIDPSRNKEIGKFMADLRTEIKRWRSRDQFHGAYAKRHTYFNVLNGISKAKDPLAFARSIQKAGILEEIFPELIDVAIPSSAEKPAIADVRDVIEVLKGSLRGTPKQASAFKRHLALIADRLG